MTESHIRNVIEAALLAAGKPLQVAELVELFDEGAARPTVPGIQAVLATLTEEYSTRGIEVKETAAGFRIQVRRELANEISRLWPERPAKYTRALLETLALIAYRQPITRAEIEAVRGVAVNPNILKTVIERNWVRVVGHRDVPGRPELLGTTRDFLDYFGLRSLDELPPLAQIKAIGEIKVQFDLPDPGQLSADVAGADASDSGAGGALADGTRAEGAADGSVAADAAGGAVVGAHESGGTASAEALSAEAPSTEVADGDNTSQEAVAREGVVGHDDVAGQEAVLAAQDDLSAKAAGMASTGDDAVASEDTHDVSKPTGRPSRGKKRRGKAHASDSALHEAEEYAANVDADLAAVDDDSSDEDELLAAGPDSTELVAGPRDIDD